MENPSRRPRLAWLALATLGTLLLLSSTRYLLRIQLQTETLTSPTDTNLSAERAAAAQMPNDYPIQLALAMDTPHSFAVPTDADPMAQTKARNRRIAALAQQFPNNPSVYANLMRYMTLGEMHLRRNEDGSVPLVVDKRTSLYQTPSESFEMFDAAAQKGAQLDPDNAYFLMMRAIGLFDARRDTEALNALKAAGRCSHWTEYYQDDVDGQNRLQTATYGERGALPRVNNVASLLFPQYASLRAVARLAVHLAGDAESDGNTAEGVAIRHALMRCGGLMRSQGTSYITALVGVAIANIGTANPVGIQNHDKLASNQSTGGEEAEKLRAKRLQSYYAYLESLGQQKEADWAKTEIAAGEQARAIGAEGVQKSVFNSGNFSQIGFAWIANLALLSSAIVLLVLGASAHLAASVRPKRARLVWRFAYALLIFAGIGLWQWQAARVGMAPLVEIQRIFCCFTENRPDGHDNALALQSLTAGLSLLVPVLFVGLIAAITLFQRVPLATGLGRGLRGAAFPVAAVLFLLYAGSLLPTVHAESVLNAEIANTTSNETHYFAEIAHKSWPGDPQP
jgi:hypothetical protein